MTLLEQQKLFSRLMAEFILWLTDNGYEVTMGDCHRSKEQAALNAKNGVGIRDSLHCLSLAVDLNIFSRQKLLETVYDYEPIGLKWISMHPLAHWGGTFTPPDMAHFSLAFGGVK